MRRYRDYYWNEGMPKGISPISEPLDSEIINYKIISDPYYKWISIEKYLGEIFQSVIYDSHLFDFRCLKPINQTAWDKIFIGTTQEQCFIRDQNDRIILFEDYTFEGNRCRMCRASSAHNIPVSTQIIRYTELGDPFNGAILYDNDNRPVMYKIYDVDPDSGEFTELKEEKWDMQNVLCV